MKARSWFVILALTAIAANAQDSQNVPPPGFDALFNGKDLSGWKTDGGLDKHWKVVDGVIEYDGKGKRNLATVESFGDFILLVDWKIAREGDSGIYLRGKPQVQIWDDIAAKKSKRPPGSGALFNNRKGESNPLANADRPVGEWNRFRIELKGDIVTVDLNGQRVVNATRLENWPKYDAPIPEKGPIELQDHSSPLWFRNIFVKRL